jgi:protein involved in polysaccharide export with SLBB domain
MMLPVVSTKHITRNNTVEGNWFYCNTQKKSMFARFFPLFFFILFCSVTNAQVGDPVFIRFARNEVQKRGLDEDQVIARLNKEGIDVNTVRPEQFSSLEPKVRAILDQMSAEKKTKEDEQNSLVEEKAKKIAEGNAETKANEKIKEKLIENKNIITEDVLDQVKSGKSVEEAISTQILDEANKKLDTSFIWGQQIFRNKSIRLYTQAADVKPTEDYILGVGDEVSVSIWGYSQFNGKFEIDKEGAIKPDRMPRMFLKGLTLGKAKSLVRGNFSSYYAFKPEEFELTINASRVVTVNITGEVEKMGSYTIPATNSAFNALVAAGGPSKIGSVRQIKLIKSGKQVINLDVYEFMNNPSVARSFAINEGDYIHVPVAKKVVSIVGAINRSFKYELLDNEDLIKLVEFAGGFTDNAFLGSIQIKRFVDDKEKILDVDFRKLVKSSSDFKLLNGDEVVVKFIPLAFKNKVSIKGAIEQPGEYAFSEGMKLSDLYKRAVLLENAYRKIAYLKRENIDGSSFYEKVELGEILNNENSSSNKNLRQGDLLIIFSENEMKDSASIKIIGAVRKEVELNYGTNKTLRVSDAIILAGGLTNDAFEFGYIYRETLNDRNDIEYIRINVFEALNNPASEFNKILNANDQLVILNKLTYADENQVTLLGAVRKSGKYQYDPSLKLQDVILLGGGFKEEAATNRIEIFRLVMDNNQPTQTIVASVNLDRDLKVIGNSNEGFELKPNDIVVVRSVPDFNKQLTVQILGKVLYPGAYSLIAKNERVSSLITRAGGLSADAFPAGTSLFRVEEGVGYIVMKLDEVLKNSKSPFNLILKNGDIIEIPSTKDIVSIYGATKAYEVYPEKILSGGKVNVAFEGGKSALYYVNKYTAGFADNASPKRLTVKHPNGEIRRTKNYGLFKVYPKVRSGSEIAVNTKIIKPEIQKDKNKTQVDWEKVVSTTIAQVTTIFTLILLSQQISR